MIDYQALLNAVAGRPIAPDLAADFARTLPHWQIDVTPNRVAYFVGMTAEETGGFRAYVENLNYSAAGLMQTWPHRFPTLDIAQAYAHQPQKIAEHVYGGRMGNGPEGSGDGWKYRGRGDIEITGRDAYAEAARELGLDLVAQPELLESFGGPSLEAACAFWQIHGCNELADVDGLAPITKRINGGYINLEARKRYVDRAKAELARQAAEAPAPVQEAPIAPSLPAQSAPDGADHSPAPVTAQDDPTATVDELLQQGLRSGAWQRALAAVGGAVGLAGAFLREHRAEVILCIGTALLIGLVVMFLLWLKEHRHAEVARQAIRRAQAGPTIPLNLSADDVQRLQGLLQAIAATRPAA